MMMVSNSATPLLHQALTRSSDDVWDEDSAYLEMLANESARQRERLEKKEAGKKTAAPSGDKKKRTKTRKETYSSYIYKGEFAGQRVMSAISRICSAPMHSSHRAS